MLLNTISSLSCSGNQTWTNMNLGALYSDQGKAQSSHKLCYLFFCCLKVSTHAYSRIPRKDKREWERKTEWVTSRQWEEDEKRNQKNFQLCACILMVAFQSIWAKDRKRVPSCLIILEQKKLKDRHGMGEALDRPAYFNCCTGVLNEEAHSRTYLMLRV